MSSLDWAYHVRRADLPADASKDALHKFIGDLFAVPMDVSKPMWQFYVVESLQADGGIRAAVVPRVHHVLGDGTSLVHLFLNHLVDQGHVKATPRTRMATGKPKLRLDTGLLAPVRAVSRRVSVFARGVVDGVLGTMFAADTKTLMKADTAYESGGARRLTMARPVPISRLRQIKAAIGGTVNDVLVAALCGAIRK